MNTPLPLEQECFRPARLALSPPIAVVDGFAGADEVFGAASIIAESAGTPAPSSGAPDRCGPDSARNGSARSRTSIDSTKLEAWHIVRSQLSEWRSTRRRALRPLDENDETTGKPLGGGDLKRRRSSLTPATTSVNVLRRLSYTSAGETILVSPSSACGETSTPAHDMSDSENAPCLTTAATPAAIPTTQVDTPIPSLDESLKAPHVDTPIYSTTTQELVGRFPDKENETPDASLVSTPMARTSRDAVQVSPSACSVGTERGTVASPFDDQDLYDVDSLLFANEILVQQVAEIQARYNEMKKERDLLKIDMRDLEARHAMYIKRTERQLAEAYDEVDQLRDQLNKPNI